MSLPLIGTPTDSTRPHNEAVKVKHNSARESTNVQIMQTLDKSQLSAKDRPLSLLYQAAITKINEQLEPTQGRNAIQHAMDTGLDVSPKATADRIVSQATGFYAAYQLQHPNEQEEELVQRFLGVIGAGIEQGFAEAREILDGLKVLEGDIAENIDQTYQLVQQGLEEFRQQFGTDSRKTSVTAER